MEAKVQERFEGILGRLESVSSKLDLSQGAPARERDSKVAELLVEAAEYAAIACDLHDTSSILSRLIIAEDLDGLLPESFGRNPHKLVLLGVGIPAFGNEDALSQVARFFEAVEEQAEANGDDEAVGHVHVHVHGHLVRGCASPDIDELFADKGKTAETPQPIVATHPADDKQPQDAAQLPKDDAAGEALVPPSKDPIKGTEEVAEEMFKRADSLIAQAELLLVEPLDEQG